MQLIIPPVKGLSPAWLSMPSEDRFRCFTVKGLSSSTQLSIYIDELNSIVALDWVPRYQEGNLCLTHDLLQIQSQQCHDRLVTATMCVSGDSIRWVILHVLDLELSMSPAGSPVW